MDTHSSILAEIIPWTEDPGRHSPWGHKESDTIELLSTLAQIDHSYKFCLIAKEKLDFVFSKYRPLKKIKSSLVYFMKVAQPVRVSLNVGKLV